MSDIKTFPSPEPPPHPGSGEQPTPVANSPFNALEPAPQVSETPVQPGQVPGTQIVQSPPGKKFPKSLIFMVSGLLLIVLIFIISLMLKSRGGSLVGTKGEITWWSKEDESVVMPLIDEYQSQNPNVRVKYVKQSEQDYRERLTSALASGKGPDIFEIHNSWVPMFKNDLAPLPESIMSKDDYKNSFYPVISADFITEAGIVAMPLEYDAITLYINEDIFTSALKAPPKTWDELSPIAKQLTQRGQKNIILQSGVSLGLTENVDHWPEILALMMLQNGSSLTKPEGKKAQDAFTFFLDFSRVDKDWDSTLPPSTLAFARGKLAMYFGPARRAADIAKENPSLRFKTVPIPQLPKENPSDKDITYATYWAQSVWKRSQNSGLAWNFLKFISSPDSLQKLNDSRRENNLLEKVYPRPSMSQLQKDDKILGSVVVLAPVAKSWYLDGQTFDGPTGINSQMNKVYGDTLNVVLNNGDLNQTLKKLPGQITQVISKYNSKR